MTDETPHPELDEIVNQYDDFEPIDGNEVADQLDMSLTEFGEVVEDNPRFEFGASPPIPVGESGNAPEMESLATHPR